MPQGQTPGEVKLGFRVVTLGRVRGASHSLPANPGHRIYCARCFCKKCSRLNGNPHTQHSFSTIAPLLLEASVAEKGEPCCQKLQHLCVLRSACSCSRECGASSLWNQPSDLRTPRIPLSALCRRYLCLVFLSFKLKVLL